MKQLPLPVRLRASSVFASFFSGPNAAVVQQLSALESGVRPPAIWIYGPAGVGKTHLLQAVCARAGERRSTSAYFPLSDSSIAPDMLTGCESLQFICLDDFDCIAGRGEWERAVFRLYTELDESGGRLLIASEAPPSGVNIALKDLASRLAAGLQLRVRPLNDEEQIGALRLRAAQLGLELPADTTQFLLHRLPRDMTTLCNALDTLDQASLATQRRLTVPFVRDVIGQEHP